MILIVGSTGIVGSEICRILASKGIPFRAMVRETSDPVKVERLKGYKAQIVKGNLCDPASLKAVCQGVDQVICTVSAMPFLSSRVPSMVKNMLTSYSMAAARLAKKKGVAQRRGVSGPLVITIITLSSAIFRSSIVF